MGLFYRVDGWLDRIIIAAIILQVRASVCRTFRLFTVKPRALVKTAPEGGGEILAGVEAV